MAANTDHKQAEFCLGAHQFAVVRVGSPASQRQETAINEVARFRLGSELYALVIEAAQPAVKGPNAAELLTGRELQIAALIAQGLLNKQVADKLGISEWTVCAHLRRIYTKLGVTSRAAMAYRCAQIVDGKLRRA